MVKLKRNVGILIVVVSFVISLIPFWLFIGFPLFLLGANLILLSDKTFRFKLFWILTPLALWYPFMKLILFIFGLIGTVNAQKLDFIFPENFKGISRVISNMPCGKDIELKDGRVQLVIPESGILLYNGAFKNGYTNERYFKIDSKEKLTIIPIREQHMYFDSFKKKPDRSIEGIWIGGFGKNYSQNNKIDFSFREFVISSKDSLESLKNFKNERELERTINLLVDTCRNLN